MNNKIEEDASGITAVRIEHKGVQFFSIFDLTENTETNKEIEKFKKTTLWPEPEDIWAHLED
jgi:hypothetical protein